MEQRNFTHACAGRNYNTWYLTERDTAVACIEHLRASGRQPLGLDLETMAREPYAGDPTAPLDPLRSRPRLVQICDGRNILIIDLLKLGHLPELQTLLEESSFVAHNAMFEIQHLIHFWEIQSPNVGCTRIATRLIYDAVYPNSAAYAADLDTVVKELLKVELPKNMDHQCWGREELNFEQIGYAANDAAVMLPIAEKLTAGLKKYGLLDIYRLYKEAQVPLAKMQLNGILMNEALHRELISTWRVEAYAAKKELLALTGLSDTNPKSMIGYLESTLPAATLALWPLTEGGEDGKEGELSLSADTFSDFSFLPIVEPFSRFKKATKLSSTYGQKLMARVSRADGRIHCSYNLCGTRTGRLSSSNPNLQQLPRDKKTRSMFIAPKGRRLVCADFNQIELRVAAELSRDPEMLRAYRNGLDLHAVTAENLTGVKLESLPPEEAKKARQSAKALNFGLLFGLGKKKFRHYAHKNYGTEMTEDEAFEAVSAWHELYAGYSEWFNEVATRAKSTLKTRTAMGKLRALSEDNYYGAAANTPVQGSASECLLQSLIRLNKVLGPKDLLLNTVHDEIMVETDADESSVARVVSALKTAMAEGFKAVFPKGITSENLVEVKAGQNWAECK